MAETKNESSVLVTGGCGFIGSNLVDELLRLGEKVIVIDDMSTGLEQNKNDGATYYEKDLTLFIGDPTELKNILVRHNVNVVFHLAASADVRMSMYEPEKVYDINLLSSISLLRCCGETNVQKFVFASTSAVFGEPKYLPVNNDHPTAPISPYGLSKLSFEQYINFFSKNSDISFMIFRFPNVFGNRQRADLEGGAIAIFKDAIDAGKPIFIFGDGEQTRDWVEVSDVVKACILAMKPLTHSHTILLASGVGVSVNETIRVMRDSTKKPVILQHVEERLGDIKHMVMDASKAEAILGWKVNRSFSVSLRQIMGVS